MATEHVIGRLWEETGKNVDYEDITPTQIKQELARMASKVDVWEPVPDGYDKYDIQHSRDVSPDMGKVRSVLRAAYDKTQADLGAKGIGPNDLVTLHRGMVAPIQSGGQVEVSGNSLESWSISKSVAADFARNYKTGEALREGDPVVLTTRVRARDIFSISTNGFGAHTEGEIIILGKRRSVSVSSPGGIPESRKYAQMVDMDIE